MDLEHLIKAKRLGSTFTELVKIDSVSREEGRLCRILRERLDKLGAATHVDDAGGKVGADGGNLIARFPGNAAAEPLLLSAHMDTVEPGRGVQPIFENGVYTSGGNTILGADDKCGLAIILEVLASVVENNLSCGPLEVVFTICEEIGLQGAKHLEYSRLSARMGYVLDSRNPEVIITRAPAANHLRFTIQGKSAHAGAEPEKGINAIALAGQAIGRLKLGRVDAETTCNIGVIHGGVATNVVPDQVVVEGEVRSHDMAKLKLTTDAMVDGFEKAVDACPTAANGIRPDLKVEQSLDFDRLRLDPSGLVVVLAQKAAVRIGYELRMGVSGGGSDANIFAGQGIAAGVLGTGCKNVHTVEERVALKDMVQSARLLMEIIQLHAKGEGDR